MLGIIGEDIVATCLHDHAIMQDLCFAVELDLEGLSDWGG